ncbi:hypothetical protein ABIE67_000523 [Streptomyces sp. V4I8]
MLYDRLKTQVTVTADAGVASRDIAKAPRWATVLGARSVAGTRRTQAERDDRVCHMCRDYYLWRTDERGLVATFVSGCDR